jgi:hypothetical protein
MRGALFGGAVGAIIGAVCGALFAAVWLCVDSAMTHERAWLVGICSGLVAYGGAVIGAFSASAQGAIGGGRAHCISVIGLSVAAGLAFAHWLFSGNPGGKQLFFAAGGAACGSVGLRWRNRRINGGTLIGGVRPRWRWLQFNLRMLLALLFAVSAGLALIVSGPLQQRRIVTRVAERGGTVRYGSTAPGWVLAMLGGASRCWFDRVTELQIIDCQDAEIHGLTRLPALSRLGLGGPDVTDQGLEELASMPGLRSLDLFDLPSISDAGLAVLPELKEVEELWLSDVHISGAGLRPLRDMPRLRSLSLFRMPIGDSDLKAIGNLEQLEELSIVAMPQLTDDGLKALKGLTKLKRLTLLSLNISDVGVAHLGA